MAFLSNDNIGDVCTRAHAAFLRNKALSVKDRCVWLKALRREIVNRSDEIAALLADTSGKTPTEALINEIYPTIGQIRYYEKNAAAILADKPTPRRYDFRGSSSFVRFQPKGVVLIISPWNFPFQLSLIPLVSALVAGNAVLLKPSELAIPAGALIQELCSKAGVPDGLVRVVPGDGATAQALIDQRPDKIFFTGSGATGRKILAAAAPLLIPVDLELGGKDPMIVFDDAPMPRTVKGAVYGAFCNSGQVCVSVERLYVQESIYTRFVNDVATEIAGLRVGAGFEADVGRMISEKQLLLVQSQIDEALQKGATLLSPRKIEGLFMAPVLLGNVNHNMKIMREETFGPVLSVMSFRDESEAIRLANDSLFGLNASVWTRDSARGRRVAAALQVGNCVVNDVIKNIGNPHLPFGGMKESGFGRYHGAEGLLAFCETQSLTFNKGEFPTEINWFPSSKTHFDHLKNFLAVLYGDGWLIGRLLRNSKTLRYFRSFFSK